MLGETLNNGQGRWKIVVCIAKWNTLNCLLLKPSSIGPVEWNLHQIIIIMTVLYKGHKVMRALINHVRHQPIFKPWNQFLISYKNISLSSKTSCNWHHCYCYISIHWMRVTFLTETTEFKSWWTVTKTILI